MKNVRKAGAAVEGAEASGKEAAGGRTAKGAAKTSSGRRSAASLLARLGVSECDAGLRPLLADDDEGRNASNGREYENNNDNYRQGRIGVVVFRIAR